MNEFRTEVLTGIVNQFYPENMVGFKIFTQWRKSPTLFEGKIAQVDILKQNRKLVEHSDGYSEAKEVEKLTRETVFLTGLYIRVKKTIKGATMQWLRKPGTKDKSIGLSMLKDEMVDLDSDVMRTIEWAIWQVIQTGKCTIDQPDVKVELDYEMPAANTPIAAVLWSNSAADIIGNIKAWKNVAAQASGKVMKYAYVTDNVMNNMMKNDGVKDMLGENGYKEQIAKSGHITRFMGLDWFVYDDGYVNSAGNFAPYLDDDNCVLLPDSKDVFQMMYGSPTEPGARPGKFSKSIKTEDPAGRKLIEEVTYIPTIHIITAIICATVL